MTADVTGPQVDVESLIARDLTRKAFWCIPVALVVGTVIAGIPGFVAAALGAAVVIANFTGAATAMSWAARISPDTLLGVTLFSYLFRMLLIIAAGFGVKAWGYPDMPVFLITVLVLHLVLLVWEARTVNAVLRSGRLIGVKE